jgi:peptidoglycan/LPS O-acetylase OafA/YrhL
MVPANRAETQVRACREPLAPYDGYLEFGGFGHPLFARGPAIASSIVSKPYNSPFIAADPEVPQRKGIMVVVNWRKRLDSRPRFHSVFRKCFFSSTGLGVARADAAPAVEVSQTCERIVELDGLRGLACLLVLVYHVMPHRIPLGWAAVDLFFVLSGYLITSIILKFSQEDHFLFNFYMRRGLRIWPIYFLTVLTVAVAVPFLPRPFVPVGLPYVLTYTQNLPLYWSGNSLNFSSYLDHIWSLAIEEQFYVLWPLLVVLVGRRGVIPLAFALLAASVSARMLGFSWLLLLARGDGLVLGSILAAIPAVRGGHEPTANRWQVIFGTAAITAVAYLAALSATGGIVPLVTPRWPALTVLAVNLLTFSIVGIVLCRRGSPGLWPLRRPRLVRIGKLSYGLYMFHYVILCLSDDAAWGLGLGGRPLWREALTVVVIFGLAAVSWRYFERPILALKDRFPYRPSGRNEYKGTHDAPALASVADARRL